MTSTNMKKEIMLDSWKSYYFEELNRLINRVASKAKEVGRRGAPQPNLCKPYLYVCPAKFDKKCPQNFLNHLIHRDASKGNEVGREGCTSGLYLTIRMRQHNSTKSVFYNCKDCQRQKYVENKFFHFKSFFIQTVEREDVI